MKKTLKTFLIAVSSAVLGVALLWGGFMAYHYIAMVDPFDWQEPYDPDDHNPYDYNKVDQEASWGHINQDITRPKDWKQIVKNSEFSLGKTEGYTYCTCKYDEPYPAIAETTSKYSSQELCKHEFLSTAFRQKNMTYPTINGSTVMVYMAVEFARQHLDMSDEDITRFVSFITTHQAYLMLFEKSYAKNICIKTPKDYRREQGDYLWVDTERPLDLFLGTGPSKEELELAKTAGVELVIKPVCRDAFVFITHKDNPVDSLTLEQVRGIYSGKIKNWNEVGGANAKIKAYQRTPGSGSQTGIEEHVMKGVPMDKAPTVKFHSGMMGLVEGVAEYQNSEYAIGYSYNYYVERQYKNENIKVLKIEGVAPTEDNVMSEKYPLSVYYYGVIRKGDENKPGGKFLDWIRSEEGQACVKQAGYIPLG